MTNVRARTIYRRDGYIIRAAGFFGIMSDRAVHVATVSGKIDLRTMKRKRSKRKAVREDRLMLLSRRESQVVELMGKGLSRAEISDRLGVSRKCVSVFIERARAKFRLKTSLSTPTFSVSIGDVC
jgi:DNA-binding NarL/FixJ family response regulator